MTDRYVTIIAKARWGGRPQGVYAVPFKILKESRDSFEFEVTDEICEKLLKAGTRLGTHFGKDEGIRTRSEPGGYRRAPKAVHYYVAKDTVLGITEGRALYHTHEVFTRACQDYELADLALAEAKRKADKQFEDEEAEAKRAYDAARKAIAEKKTNAIATETKARDDAWQRIRDVHTGKVIA